MARIHPVPCPIESYWLSEPHKFSTLRSTPDLPEECDIVIIGSGMAGITTAYHILQGTDSPPNITILEARQLCSGATARNGGHCKVKFSTLANLLPRLGPELVEEFQSYVQDVIDGIKRIVEEEELDCEFEMRRSFDVYQDVEESGKLTRLFNKSLKEGQPWTKNVAGVDEKYVEQVTSIQGARSAFGVSACSFWPYKFVTQLLERLISRYPQNLNVQTTTPVTSISIDKDGRNIISTPRGAIRSKKLIFATNAYTAGVLPMFKNVIIPVRGMASHIVPKTPVHPHLLNTYNIYFGPDKGVDYLNPHPDGSIVVGGGNWLYHSHRSTWYDNFDDSVRFAPTIEKYWDGYMQRSFLGWEHSGSSVDKVWVGIMGITPDGWPHIGRVPGTKNQWVLAGFNGGGMTMILTVAKAVAQMVTKDIGFEEVKKEFRLPTFFATDENRLKQSIAEGHLQKRN